jgi:predicted nuclease with TOPRIM domain
MQSIDSLRELNAKLLAEIAELRKKNDKIPVLEKKFAEVEAENARLKQIIEENARRDSENAELKSRVGELEARLALLEQVQQWMGWRCHLVRHKMIKKRCQW